MRRILLTTVLVGLVAAMAVPAAAAPSDAQPYAMTETMVELLDPGTEHLAGEQPVWHVRGWRALYDTSDETNDMLAGHMDVVVNWNVNLATWRGNLWGTAHYVSDAYADSGWEATWTGQWTGPGSWAGRGVGDGYGQFDGMKIRFDVRNVPVPPGQPGVVLESGVVFVPGRP